MVFAKSPNLADIFILLNSFAYRVGGPDRHTNGEVTDLIGAGIPGRERLLIPPLLLDMCFNKSLCQDLSPDTFEGVRIELLMQLKRANWSLPCFVPSYISFELFYTRFC